MIHKTIAVRIGQLLTLEAHERKAAGFAKSTKLRDAHLMFAERFADQAWIAAERSGAGYIPNALWSE